MATDSLTARKDGHQTPKPAAPAQQEKKMEALSKPSSLTKQLMDEGPFAFPFEHHDALCPGMTLRDYFAAQAIGAALGESGVPVFGWAEYIAGNVYHIADAMLHARQSPVETFAPDLAREKMGQALAAVLHEVSDGTGRTSPDSFLPQDLIDRIEAVLEWGADK